MYMGAEAFSIATSVEPREIFSRDEVRTPVWSAVYLPFVLYLTGTVFVKRVAVCSGS